MTDYVLQGAAIVDEAVACTTSATFDATPYYVGRLAQMPALSILGISDPDYGAWTATSKGGTRFLVALRPGLPSDSDSGTGSPPDLVVEPATGLVVSTISQTVYFRYLAFGTFNLGAVAAAAPYVVQATIFGVLENGVSQDHWRSKWHENLRITKAEIVAPWTGGMPPASGTATLHVRNYKSSDSADESRDVTIDAGDASGGWQTLSSPLVVTTSQDLVIHGDGKDSSNLIVNLLHEPA